MHKFAPGIAAPLAAFAGWSSARLVWIAQEAPPIPQSPSEWIYTFGIATPLVVGFYWMLRREDAIVESHIERAARERKEMAEQMRRKDDVIKELIAQNARLQAILDSIE